MDNNYVIRNGELYHWGIKGMRWGIRRTPAQLGHKPSNSEDDSGIGKTAKPSKKRKISDLSDDELRQRINRLQMEKQLKQLLTEDNQPRQSRGKAFVMDVVEKSGKNIATQLVTYAFGKGVNAAFKDVFNDPAIVNPKKGQKDK